MRVTSIACGSSHSLALLGSAPPTCSSHHKRTQLPKPLYLLRLFHCAIWHIGVLRGCSAGPVTRPISRWCFRNRDALCAHAGTGLVLSWGRGEDGQLGHGDADERTQPHAVHALQQADTSAVVCGAEYSVALSHERQEVYSWGWCAPGHRNLSGCSRLLSCTCRSIIRQCFTSGKAALPGLSVMDYCGTRGFEYV